MRPLRPRARLRAMLGDAPLPELAGLRSPGASDIAALGALMHRAYAGTVDDEGESSDDAVAEVARTFDGAYGPFDAGCSTVVERGGRLLSAALVTRWQARPFVAFSFTDPSCAGQGLARAALRRSMALLRAAGEHELRLVVTLANAPACRLYAALGFTPEE